MLLSLSKIVRLFRPQRRWAQFSLATLTVAPVQQLYVGKPELKQPAETESAGSPIVSHPRHLVP
jgi:hypothetical protein